MSSSLLKSKWQNLDLNHLFASSLTIPSPCACHPSLSKDSSYENWEPGSWPRLSPHNFVMVNGVWILGVTGLKGQDYFLPFSGQAENVKLNMALTPVKFKESKLWSWRHRLGCGSLVWCPPHWQGYLWPRPEFSRCSGSRCKGHTWLSTEMWTQTGQWDTQCRVDKWTDLTHNTQPLVFGEISHGLLSVLMPLQKSSWEALTVSKFPQLILLLLLLLGERSSCSSPCKISVSI